MATIVQQWDPNDWEIFSLSLLQGRHGPLEVHKIPAKHHGDLGIDYYCTNERVIYQCYAVDEPVDIQTRAERQNSKITTDLKKMVEGAADVSRLFLGRPVKKWVLLVPLHDSKDVNLHCAKKTAELRSKCFSHLNADFEVCIHDQESFPGAALKEAMAALININFSVKPPTKEELESWRRGSPDLLATATKKLASVAEPDNIQTVVSDGVEFFLKSTALIDALRTSAPDLHEKVVAAIASRRRRLGYAGPQGGPRPTNIIHTELDILISAIKNAVPSLSSANAEDIALGVVSEWIMRCPLDFPANVA
ncbi:MAG: hypothetical protein F8N39_09235 [Clostridiaceae bacterium]|nr:hypothetical protein [Clostridiaceae bacterium]